MIKKITKEAKRRRIAFTVTREGANHTVYSLDGIMIPVARHSEIDEQMAEIIFKECEPKLGKRWWK